MTRALIAVVNTPEPLFAALRGLLAPEGLAAALWPRAALGDDAALAARLAAESPRALVVALPKPYEPELERLLRVAGCGRPGGVPLILLAAASGPVYGYLGDREGVAVLSLPADAAEVRRLVSAAVSGAAALQRARRPPTPPLSFHAAATRPVLLIEDDRDFRGLVKEALEAEGYKVFSAYNGTSAFKLLGGVPTPGVVVLDLILPGLDGWAFLRAFKASAMWSEIPVVVVSAATESPPGVDDFLPKPVTTEQLLAAVRRRYPVPLARVG